MHTSIALAFGATPMFAAGAVAQQARTAGVVTL
jgi:hypothetical protein